MATYIRTLARMATRVSNPSSMLITRQVFKGKKHAIVDEDDEELEAELQELEREKRELEALEGKEALGADDGSSEAAAAEAASQFQRLYDNIVEHTSTATPHHELPSHTTLYHLTQAVSTKEQVELLPTAVKQWRQKALPITFLVGDKLIHAACKAGAPDVALELLGDRETYGLSPGQSTMRRVVRSFVKEVAAAGSESEEALEKLDGAFKALALIPYYNLAADDAAVYANLVRGSLLYGGEEGIRRASVTMDEYLLIDGEREKPLSRRRAAEIIAAAEQLIKAYGDKDDTNKVQELQKYVEAWKKSL
ncbi:hypothetical protein BGZ99_003221 [Dissophora globulifera]|uniref:Uncharacterized protein n=1 Tax=Dissophora globulifera TaxID=979702 RepID=A0A9P6UWC7_9FUNG|nr:hypothetical protein BGZ99_003221 [Dissophora globulifera]